jgi:hypothetical protein
MVNDPFYFIGGLAVDLAAMLVGGYVAARIAGRRQLVYAAGTGLVMLLVLVALLACCRVLTVPRLYTILASGLTIPSALLGGYAARWRARRAYAVSDATPP